jgi:hypothetical protein
MEPLKQATPSSGIEVLFTQKVRFEGDPKIIEQKLRNSGLATIENLKEVQVQDLTSLGISFFDASIVIDEAK